MWDEGVSGRRGVRRREMAWRRGVEWRRERVGKEGCAEMICAKLQPVMVWASEERWPWASMGGLVCRLLGWGVGGGAIVGGNMWLRYQNIPNKRPCNTSRASSSLSDVPVVNSICLSSRSSSRCRA